MVDYKYIIQVKIHFLVLLAVLLCYKSGKAQAPYYYTLNEENGLPSSEVYQVLQDSFGYIWIGCDAGLFRFDGLRFKQYNYRRENGKSISELKLDAHGNVWCQNFNGQLFRVINDSLVLFKDFSGVMRNYPQYTVDKNNRVWVVGNNAILVYDSSAVLLDKIYNINHRGDTLAWFDVEINANDEVYATSQFAGLYKLTINQNKTSLTPIKSELLSGYKPFLEKVKNHLFILSEVTKAREYALYEITADENCRLITKVKLNQFVYKTGITAGNEIWFTTSNGILPLRNKAISYENQLLAGDKISSMFEDREGNLWLTSLQNGIHIIPNTQLLIYNRQNSALEDNFISTLTLNQDNSLLFGTYTGLIYNLTQGGQIKPINTHKATEYRLTRKILPYKNGYLVSRGSFGFINATTEAIMWPANVRDFDVLNDTLYFVASNSVSRLDGLESAIKHNDKTKKPVLIYDKAGRSMAIDRHQHVIYFATINGLLAYRDGKLTPLTYNNERIIAAKLVYENDKLWIGSLNNGVLSYDGTVVREEQQINRRLKGNTIKTFKMHHNAIYIATEQCLNCIALNGKSGEYYDVSDGLVSKEINAIEIVNNKLFLATNKGLVSFPLGMHSTNTALPNIAIDEVKLNNQKLKTNLPFKLSYNSGILKIKITTSCIRARGHFYYSYCLNGLDTAFTVVNGSVNEVIYNSLPPGTYTFMVSAMNEDGKMSKNKSSLFFTVDKPFWQQLWFYAAIALAGALLVLLVSAFVIRNVKTKASVRNELINSQLTAIRAQMNPHFIYNTLNSIQDLILKSDIKNTNHYLSRFSSLMRKILDFSSLEKVPLSDEIEMLENYLELEKLRFGNDFSYTINLTGNPGAQNQIPSLIIQPFVENAVKHGLLHKKGLKQLHINFKSTNEAVEVSITDNGVGRTRSDEIKSRNRFVHNSFATGAVQKRLELLNTGKTSKIMCQVNDLFENGEPAGTQILLLFPM